MNFLRKSICFTKFPTFMKLFGHWAKSVQNFILLCSAGPSKKQPISPEVLCDEKQKVSYVSNKGVFFIIVYGLRSQMFALSKKKLIVLVLKTLLYVFRGMFSEKIFVSKSSFFCKMLPGIEGKYFGLLGKLFPARLSSFRSTFAEGGFREKFFEKKLFFHCFQTWSKKSTIERTSGWISKLYSTCPLDIF